MTVTRTVEPGDWYGVLGDHVIVLLPPSAKSRVAGLWETVDDGGGFDEVLDAVISRGLRELPSFVLLSGVGREVKVVIRGAALAELVTHDGAVTVSGSADTTWVEQNVSGVTALRVRVAEATGPSYTVGPGLVRVAGVQHPGTPTPAPADAPAEVLPTLADAEVVAVPVAPAPPPESIRRPILPPDPQLSKPEPEPEVVAAAPAPPAVPEASVAPVDDPDPTRLVSSGPRVPRLVFSSGEVVDLDRAVVVGRAPDQARAEGEPARLVTVPSPHHEISATHVEIQPGTGPDEDMFLVTDLGSTNGTVVVQPGRPAEDLRPGIAVPVGPGATIDLGEGVTIQLEG